MTVDVAVVRPTCPSYVQRGIDANAVGEACVIRKSKLYMTRCLDRGEVFVAAPFYGHGGAHTDAMKWIQELCRGTHLVPSAVMCELRRGIEEGQGQALVNAEKLAVGALHPAVQKLKERLAREREAALQTVQPSFSFVRPPPSPPLTHIIVTPAAVHGVIPGSLSPVQPSYNHPQLSVFCGLSSFFWTVSLVALPLLFVCRVFYHMVAMMTSRKRGLTATA
jgi:hypothetical protein